MKIKDIQSWIEDYKPPCEYSNLWVVQLNDKGKCEEFIEWWMKHD